MSRTTAADVLAGVALRDARRRRGLRQSEVAQAVDVSLRTYRSYESGETSMPMLRRPLLARSVGLKPEVLGAVPETPPTLAPDEAAWLALYRRLPSWIRELFRRRLPATATPDQEPARC